MRSRIAKFACAAGAAALLAVSSYVPAEAGGKEAGAFLGGLVLGGIIGSQRPYYANPPGPHYAPAPVYVQPRVCWRNERYYDPYYGYRFRKVQYYC